MKDYRINVRFRVDKPEEKAAAEYLKSLHASRNKFVVDAVIAHMDNCAAEKALLENIRQIFREEVQYVPAAAVAPEAFSTELTEAAIRFRNPEGGGYVATTGFWPVKGRLKDAIDYAENPDKTTDRKFLDDDL